MKKLYLQNIIINTNKDDYANKNEYTLKTKTLPRKGEKYITITSYERFKKDNFIKSLHTDIDNIISYNLQDLNEEENNITNFKLTFSIKNKDNKKIRKPRMKKVYKVLEENIIEAKYQLYPSSFILYPTFISTEKENDINLIFPFLNGSQIYTRFVDVLFSTGNFYFFMNLKNNIINIPNLPTYAFYKALQRGIGKTINSYISPDSLTFSENLFEEFKSKLNTLLKEYENNLNNEKLENDIAFYYYCLTKIINKQTLKYRNQQVISKYNVNYAQIFLNPSIENFYLTSLLNNTVILYTEEYYELINQCNDPTTIIFLDLIQKPLDFYKLIGYDEQQFFNLFSTTSACMIIILPNTYFNRQLFNDYIKNISEYKNDRRNYNMNRTINTKKKLYVCNKLKYI
jgi:hypothetical protein